MLENDEVSIQIGRLGATACVDLFRAYGVSLERSPESWTLHEGRLVSGVVGFVGRQVRGTCLLAGAEQPLRDSCPVDGRLRDWVGELANQLVGRIKTSLVASGSDVALSTPIVLSGIKLQPLPRGGLEPTLLAAPSGPVMVWVEVEAQPDFVLRLDGPEGAPRDGGVLFF